MSISDNGNRWVSTTLLGEKCVMCYEFGGTCSLCNRNGCKSGSIMTYDDFKKQTSRYLQNPETYSEYIKPARKLTKCTRNTFLSHVILSKLDYISKYREHNLPPVNPSMDTSVLSMYNLVVNDIMRDTTPNTWKR